MHIDYRIELRCTQEQLWPYLDEPEKLKLWVTTLVDAGSTSKLPRAVGATFEMHVREGRRVARYDGRINSYDPPRHLGVSFWGGFLPPSAVIQVDYRTADLGNRTRLEYSSELDTSSLSGPTKLALPIARIFTFFQIRYFFRNLKRIVEAASRSEASRERGESRPRA
jgi:hypothetical protein